MHLLHAIVSPVAKKAFKYAKKKVRKMEILGISPRTFFPSSKIKKSKSLNIFPSSEEQNKKRKKSKTSMNEDESEGDEQSDSETSHSISSAYSNSDLRAQVLKKNMSSDMNLNAVSQENINMKTNMNVEETRDIKENVSTNETASTSQISRTRTVRKESADSTRVRSDSPKVRKERSDSPKVRKEIFVSPSVTTRKQHRPPRIVGMIKKPGSSSPLTPTLLNAENKSSPPRSKDTKSNKKDNDSDKQESSDSDTGINSQASPSKSPKDDFTFLYQPQPYKISLNKKQRDHYKLKFIDACNMFKVNPEILNPFKNLVYAYQSYCHDVLPLKIKDESKKKFNTLFLSRKNKIAFALMKLSECESIDKIYEIVNEGDKTLYLDNNIVHFLKECSNYDNSEDTVFTVKISDNVHDITYLELAIYAFARYCYNIF
ncbi:uncharacterized protein VNE69_11034 [Vairimorpha necatrix]|uniref:Uncharacterized protein n=1 Tax=Vairimorpha necatrix TaxID=6039 RepID=A0AAX4JFX9_9MICR